MPPIPCIVIMTRQQASCPPSDPSLSWGLIVGSPCFFNENGRFFHRNRQKPTQKHTTDKYLIYISFLLNTQTKAFGEPADIERRNPCRCLALWQGFLLGILNCIRRIWSGSIASVPEADMHIESALTEPGSSGFGEALLAVGADHKTQAIRSESEDSIPNHPPDG